MLREVSIVSMVIYEQVVALGVNPRDLLEAATLLLAVYGLLHQARSLRERKIKIAELQEETAKLQKELNDLTGHLTVKQLKLVESTMHDLNPTLCATCKDLLYLRISTSFGNAMEHLDRLGQTAELHSKTVDRGVIHDVLKRAIEKRLWKTPLESDRPESEFITQAVKAYSNLISNVDDGELRGAIRFCVESCFSESAILKREVVRRLLPKLLVESRGDNDIVQVYKRLFENSGKPLNEENKLLLVSIFGGLDVAVKVNAAPGNTAGVRDIWKLTFTAAINNVAWAWGEDGGPNIGTLWCHAIEKRLARTDNEQREFKEEKAEKEFKEEIEFLRNLISEYLIQEHAPQEAVSYRELGRILGGGIRPRIVRGTPGFRIPDRAVVPKATHIRVEIAINGTSITGKLVNFSLEETTYPPKGRGAWVTADPSEALDEIKEWRSAKVAIVYPQPGSILFEQALVSGPLRQGTNNNPFWGFRIQLGTPSPPDAILPLRQPLDDWTKR